MLTAVVVVVEEMTAVCCCLATARFLINTVHLIPDHDQQLSYLQIPNKSLNL